MSEKRHYSASNFVDRADTRTPVDREPEVDSDLSPEQSVEKIVFVFHAPYSLSMSDTRPAAMCPRNASTSIPSMFS